MPVSRITSVIVGTASAVFIWAVYRLTHRPVLARGGNTMPGKVRAFISFDYDLDLKNLLVGQAANPDSPFEIADYSIKDASADWKAKARTRIRTAQQVIVICGEHTDIAAGVSEEIRIAQAERKPYFLLAGRANKANKRPVASTATDKVYTWTWDNLKTLISGGR